MYSPAPLFPTARARRNAASTREPKPGVADRAAGIERDLWKAANALRNSVDAAEFKHVLLGLVFLKYASAVRESGGIRVPEPARWPRILECGEDPRIGSRLNAAMAGIEEANPGLRDALPRRYVRPGLTPELLGRTVALVNRLSAVREPESSAADRPGDLMGRVYEYLLSQFASAEGRKGGEFYTPRCVVSLLVTMLQPWRGRVYDPCCGSGGMFVQSVEFVRAHAANGGALSVYGQESNHTTWKLARMNMAIRGIEADIAFGDTFQEPAHPSLKADFVLANPPFNISSWNGHLLKQDSRWRFGVPPESNANFAWVQHIVHHLGPEGVAGIVLANGSMSSRQGGEDDIRRKLVEADLVDCVVALPGQLFYSTPIPVCVWIFARDKASSPRDRSRETLFIDARALGTLTDRTHRELEETDLDRIAGAYRAHRGDGDATGRRDEPGFSRTATLEDIREAGYDVNPGRYVRAPVSPSRTLPETSLAASVGRLGALAADLKSTLDDFTETAAALPERLQDVVRRIASGGAPGTVGDLVTAERCLVDPRRHPSDWFELYSIPALDADGLPERRQGREIMSAKLRVTAPCLLVSRLNPRRMRVWPVDHATERAVCSTEFAVLAPRDPGVFEYLHLVFRSRPFQEHLVARATGSTGSRQRVRIQDVLGAPITIPRGEDIERLNELLRPLNAWRQGMPRERRSVADLADRVCELVVSAPHRRALPGRI